MPSELRLVSNLPEPARFLRPARRVARMHATGRATTHHVVQPEPPTIRQRIGWWLAMHRDLQDAIGKWAVRLAILIMVASLVASFVDAWDREQHVTTDSSGEVEVVR